MTSLQSTKINILRTFYVVGLEQSYAINHRLFGFESKMDFGARIYFERFIDDKQNRYSKPRV